jgi:transcriptional regulator with XRE-family HTH domain
MGRPHALADPDYAELVADCFAAGMTREQMCDILGVADVKTITRWRRDPRVQNRVIELIRDRAVKITLKADAEMMNRMMNAENLTVREIIEIRREFMGDKLRSQTDEVDENTINEAQKFFDDNPDAAEQLRKLLSGGTLPAPEPG